MALDKHVQSAFHIGQGQCVVERHDREFFNLYEVKRTYIFLVELLDIYNNNRLTLNSI